MDILKKAAATIKEHSMLSGGESVLVGLSGGPDSVCLLMVLNALMNRWGKLHALYIDHGLRPKETPREIEFCKDLCRRLDIPFAVKAVDVSSHAREHGLNRQEAGRLLRYQAFESYSFEINARRIAVGHNLDDRLETFLMHLLRGSGPKGLYGIPPVRGNIIRPLIYIGRKDIEGFLTEHNTGYIVDSSNLKTDYLRNRIRQSIVPALKELNPSILSTFSRTLEILGEEDRHLELQTTKALMKLITKKTDAAIELFLSPLEFMEKVLLRRTLRRAIAETRGLRRIGFTHIEDMIRLIKTGAAGDRLYLPGGIRAIKKYATLLITSETPSRLGTYTVEADGDVVLKEAGLIISAKISGEMPPAGGNMTAVFDADKVSFPLTVRGRMKGDFFYPAGFGKKKKLQDFFVDEKVPRDERDAIPIVTTRDDILWVAGMRGDERFKTSADTRRFLLLEIKEARRQKS